MKLLIVSAIALSATMSATAAERVARPLTASAFRDVAAMSQDVTLTGLTTTSATIAPLTTSGNGFGLSKMATKMTVAPVNGMPMLGISSSMNSEDVIRVSHAWVNYAFPSFKDRYAAWLRSKGLSIGFYNYSQEVMVQTSIGPRKKTVSFNAVVDSSGKPTYGMPKLVDSDPLTLDVRYVPLAPDVDLPSNWKFDGAGTLSWRLLNKKMEPVTGWEEVATNGAFDSVGEDVLSDAQVACLMDRASSPSCTGPTDVKDMLLKTGATTAFVSYARSVAPVYEGAQDSEELSPVMAISVDERVQSCGKYTNKGSYGYLLESSTDQYVASLESGAISFNLLSQQAYQMVSPTQTYEKSMEVPKESLGVLDQYIISPQEGANELLSRLDPIVTRGTVNLAYVSPIKVVSDGSFDLAGDSHISKTGGGLDGLTNYAMNYSGGAVYGTQYNYFTISDPWSLQRLALTKLVNPNPGYSIAIALLVNGQVIQQLGIVRQNETRYLNFDLRPYLVSGVNSIGVTYLGRGYRLEMEASGCGA